MHLLQDHTGDEQGGMPGDLYFITKFYPKQCYLQRLGKISVQEHESVTPGSSKEVYISSVSELSINTLEWTDGSMNLEGNLIAVRTYKGIKFFPRTPFQTVADALGSAACNYSFRTIMRSDQRQFESVTFVSSQRVAEASECLDALSCTLNVTSYRLLFNAATNNSSTSPSRQVS
jgi:hypothetical protein